MRRGKEDYQNAIENSRSIAQVCKKLGLKQAGGNYLTIKNAIERYDIDVSHFSGKGWNVGLKFKPNKPLAIDEILVENSNYQSSKLKERLFAYVLKDRKCECCLRSEWNGSAIPLEIHHINGNNHDNRIENLQILCPNCHAQTDNYRGKNKGATMVK